MNVFENKTVNMAVESTGRSELGEPIHLKCPTDRCSQELVGAVQSGELNHGVDVGVFNSSLAVYIKRNLNTIHSNYADQLVVFEHDERGFQTYLDKWKTLYPGLLDLTHCGKGLVIYCNLIDKDTDSIYIDWNTDGGNRFAEGQTGAGGLEELLVGCEIALVGRQYAIIVTHLDSHFYHPGLLSVH
jgi:hypothetical protein